MFWFGMTDDEGPKPTAPDPADPQQTAADPNAQDPDLEEEGEVNDLVLGLLPWLVSFLLHAGLVLLAIFIVWSAIDPPDDDQPIIPSARLSRTPDAPVQARSEQTQTTTESSSRSVVQSPNQTRAPIESKVKTKSTLIGVRGSSATGSNPFGTGVGTSTGIGTKFFGTGGNAYKLVYLIDSTGSLIDSLDYVILELKRSINDLSPEQSFSVIFFQGQQVIEVKPKGLKKATQKTKAQVIEWIDPSAGNITPMMPGNPIPALQLALRYKPDLIYILSDNITGSGRYEIDQRRLLAEVEKANKGQTAINTIQFLYPDKLEEYGLEPTLALIAARSGGAYKFVDARELGIE